MEIRYIDDYTEPTILYLEIRVSEQGKSKGSVRKNARLLRGKIKDCWGPKIDE
jgi:hypothetical protein